MKVKSKRLAQLTLQLLCAASFAGFAQAEDFNIPRGDLKAALDSYATQTGTQFIYESAALKGIQTQGVHGNLSADTALSRILTGTGFTMRKDATGAVGISRTTQSVLDMPATTLAQAAPARAAVETVTVTSSKLGGADVQSIPIAITALSQEQLTSRQIAGGPDLVKEVPNLTFSKTNFTGYNIQIRGIGTQAISVTTDPAVAVAFNDLPFIRNHFFEQEFYDVGQVEVLRGPQGTLYGRNATAGVVNVVSAKPTDQFEVMASADIGNYHNRRFEGVINLPIVDDRLDLRVAGEWTKRDGYSFNALTNSPIDGRDLWSGRVTIGFKPSERLRAYLVWEHFQEDDDRLRSSKQLCKRDPGPAEVGGVSTDTGNFPLERQAYLSQGCLPASMYSPEAFGVVNGFSLPYYGGLLGAGSSVAVTTPLGTIQGGHADAIDPYASQTQSTDLRVIESLLDPSYRARNDVVELNTDFDLTPMLTITSQTGFSHDLLWSTEDYNRFNTQPGIFHYDPNTFPGIITPEGNFCDPQLGCSDRLVAEDLSVEHALQLNQEFRLASHFSGPLNFSFGGNYLHYETAENYYVFINTLSMFSSLNIITSQTGKCRSGRSYPDPTDPGDFLSCRGYIDPNPIGSLNDQGHNYFLSQNPYTLNSYAGFGEVYYQVFDELKLTGGLRWTDDEKHFVDIPSELLTNGYGYPSIGNVDQSWKEWTGRFAANWTPHLDFTDQTLVYGAYSHGYKAGGANPPSAVLLVLNSSEIANPIHPLTFRPEFIDAFELGTKNSLSDGGLTINGNVFYYNYKDYQISEIMDRTAINLNFDAQVKGAELEATWEPAPGLRFSFAGGYEDARLANGSSAVDLMDRTAGNPSWVVVKPYVTQASNCILPAYVIGALYSINNGNILPYACGNAYVSHLDPVTSRTYTFGPSTNYHGDAIAPGAYPGFDPVGADASNGGAGPAPNNGAGFDKDLSGNELPNAPHFTTSLTAEFTRPVTQDWAATLHGDFYWQSASHARVFNDDPYDRIHGYTNLNLALIFTSSDGWQAIGYLKNVFDVTAITGAFLNSDDTGLTTNVFLTDPRLFGVRVTKNF